MTSKSLSVSAPQIPNSMRQRVKTPEEVATIKFRELIMYRNGGVGFGADEDASELLRLIEQGANVNGPANDGEIMRTAIQIKHPNAVRVLLALGADPNATGVVPKSRVLADPMSPLHLAVKVGSALSCLQLIAAGADRFKKNRKGQTPAELARKEDKIDLADAIFYPLHTAVMDYPNAFFQLLKFGFSPLEKDANGKTVLEVGEAGGDEESMHLARSWIARKEALESLKAEPENSRKKQFPGKPC